MVFILGASSLHHALETLPTEEKSSLKEKIHTIPGLSLNNYAKNMFCLVPVLFFFFHITYKTERKETKESSHSIFCHFF